MRLSKNHWFGVITFILLIIASYLVTVEPWKSSSGKFNTSMSDHSPMEIHIEWINLATGYPLAYTTDTIYSYTGFDLGYNEQFEQASWVAYVLSRNEIESGEIESWGIVSALPFVSELSTAAFIIKLTL